MSSYQYFATDFEIRLRFRLQKLHTVAERVAKFEAAVAGNRDAFEDLDLLGF
jgi:hypothetical protein